MSSSPYIESPRLWAGNNPPASRYAGAFTLLEVLISAALISLTIGSIVAMDVRSANALHTSRVVAAGSQILQQRVEAVRQSPWAAVSSSAAMLALLQAPTPSEAELGAAFIAEEMTVTVPAATSGGLQETPQFFAVRRSRGVATVTQSGDFSTQPTLLFQGTLTWKDKTVVHQRTLRTVVCSTGLTRCGVVGTALGRPGTQTSSP